MSNLLTQGLGGDGGVTLLGGADRASGTGAGGAKMSIVQGYKREPRPLWASRHALYAGVERLAALPLTINGVTVAPLWQFVGTNATATTWAARRGSAAPTLTQTGAGTTSTLNQTNAYDTCGVKFNGSGGAAPSGKSYVAGTTVGNVATEDCWTELVFLSSAGAQVETIAAKFSAGDTEGWTIQQSGTTLTITITIAAQRWPCIRRRSSPALCITCAGQ